MRLNKIDLTGIVAIGHADDHLQLLIDRGMDLEYIEIPAPLQAYEGLRQLEAIAEPEALEVSIEMLPVHSTMANSVGYDGDRQVLQVEFQNGSMYQYADVDADTWAALQEADSTGRFFNQEIRGHYRSRCID